MKKLRIFHWVLAAVLIGAVAACGRREPVQDELVGVQMLISAPNRTATRAAIKTATATAWVAIRATATADWLPTGRKSLQRDYTEWQLAGTLVARQTATNTATATNTSTPTATFTLTPTATATP